MNDRLPTTIVQLVDLWRIPIEEIVIGVPALDVTAANGGRLLFALKDRVGDALPVPRIERQILHQDWRREEELDFRFCHWRVLSRFLFGILEASIGTYLDLTQTAMFLQAAQVSGGPGGPW